MEKLFIDTNILIYATDAGSPFQQAALQSLEKYDAEYTLCISSQVLREYAAASKAAGVLNIEEITDNIAGFASEMNMLWDSERTLADFLMLLKTYDPPRKDIYDCNITATMTANGVQSILTHNGRDFMRYKEISVIPLV